MTLSRKLARLRKMSSAEITTRGGQALRTHWERLRYLANRPDGVSAGELAAASDGLCHRARAFLPGARGEDMAWVEEHASDALASITARASAEAEQLAAGRLELLGRKLNLNGGADWHRDPVTGYVWERRFFDQVPIYELGDGVDVKRVWELSRHQFLVPLAEHWRLCGEPGAAAQTREFILDWIDQNPEFEGVNWTSALEVAVRSISWLWVMGLTAEWDGWRHEDKAAITRSLHSHARYLYHHLSYFSSPYNHLVGEATGLLLIGQWLTELPESAKWRRRARQVLEKHGPAQFYRDGFCVEQAFGYHYFTLGFLAQAVHGARIAGEPLLEVERRLPTAFEAGAALMCPDGRWPAVGDVDSARAIPAGTGDYWDFRSLCALGAVLCGSATLKQVAGTPGGEMIWMLGKKGLETWRALACNAPSLATVLPDAGYAVARSGHTPQADWVLFDAGPIAAGLHEDETPSVAHGHADTLGVLLYQHGHPVLVDSGMPDYSGSREWVDYFRSPMAHNTLEVDGAPIARTAGRLAWSHVCPSPRLDANLSAECWLIRGRVDLPAGVTIRRHVLGLAGSGIWIADQVHCDRERNIQWSWHLGAALSVQGEPPRLEAVMDTRSLVRTSRGVLATWAGGRFTDITLSLADEHSPKGWLSAGYGVRAPGYHVHHQMRSKDALVVTFIGEALIASRVAVDDHALQCPFKEPLSIPDQSDGPAGDIIWHVSLKGTLTSFAAGFEPEETVGPWSRLNGVGQWPAAVLVQADERSPCG